MSWHAAAGASFNGLVVCVDGAARLCIHTSGLKELSVRTRAGVFAVCDCRVGVVVGFLIWHTVSSKPWPTAGRRAAGWLAPQSAWNSRCEVSNRGWRGDRKRHQGLSKKYKMITLKSHLLTSLVR